MPPLRQANILRRYSHKQHGAALMVMLVILIIGIATILVNALSRSGLQIERDIKTAEVLAQAKEALISFAITYGDTHPGEVHGYLPCPDTNGTQAGNLEGSSELSCGSKNVSMIGRLPWKTIDLPPLRDNNDECLWYAVSGNYKYNPKTDLMNWDNQGLLGVSGASGNNVSDIAAIILAPGSPLANQNRTPSGYAPICGGNYTASNYLDSDATIGANNAAPSTGANAISQFFTGGTTTNINDQIIFITRDDIFNAIKKRNDFQSTSPNNVLYNMTQAVAACLASASSPQPNPLYGSSTTNGWVPPANTLKNYNSTCAASYNRWNNWWSNWNDHLFYVTNSPNVNGTTCNSVVIFANQKLSGQSRRNTTPDNYLEGNNLSSFKNGSTAYQTSTLSSTFNDVLVCNP